MKALVQSQYGSTDLLTLRERPARSRRDPHIVATMLVDVDDEVRHGDPGYLVTALTTLKGCCATPAS